jgi:hypothetical protein
VIAEDVIDLVHVDASGEYVYSPDTTDADEDWIINHPTAVEALLAERTNPSGFYVRLPRVIEQFLRAATMVSLDSETTNLTSYAPPIKMTAKTQIGEESLPRYRAQYPECTIDTRPRLRVLAVHAIGRDASESFAFDLDRMPAEDRHRLIDVVIDGKVIVGHNVIGFDMNWLLAETTRRPRLCLDTLILTRQCGPKILTYLNFDAAKADEARALLAIETLTGKSETRASLDFIATCLGLPKLSKEFQHPRNWCVSDLSPKHLNYVLADIQTPLEILRHIFGTLDPDQIIFKIGTEYPWYLKFERAGMIMTTRPGVPFSEEGAAKLEAELTADLIEAAKAFERDEWSRHFTDEVRAILADPKKGLSSQTVIDALAAHAAEHGLTLPATEKGNVSTGSKEMKLAGLTTKLPCWAAWDRVAKLKKQIGLIVKYREYARTDGRLHSLIAWITAAGRTSSSDPNLQAMPRDSKLRALVAAAECTELVWADYSTIELRIASRIAARAINRARKVLKETFDHDDLDYFHKSSWYGLKSTWQYPPEKRPDSFNGTDDEYRMKRPGMLISYVASIVIKRKEQALSRVFRLGLDPHLVTALSMARMQGFIEIEGDVTEWLEHQSAEQRDELKERFKAQRTAAKCTNFGLTYGMQPPSLFRYGVTEYSLTWTEDDATAAHRLWFETYPEILFVHLYTKYVCGRKIGRDDVLVWNRWTGAMEKSLYGAKMYETTTLAGRPICVLDQITQALAYQGQGSGVDILVEAINSLPPHLLDALRLPVHDELLLEAPLGCGEQYKDDLEKVMIEAASRVLGPTMPVEVEGKRKKFWGK